MSFVIGVMGQSGHGKTTAMRTLKPEETYYIDADRKGLNWRGWTKQYVDGKNYLRSSDAGTITAQLRTIDKKRPEIKQVVIDTANGIMLDAEMGRIKETGYGKWTELAADVYDMLMVAGQLRHDLIVIVGFRVAIAADGEGVDHILTNGRKLEKIHLEAKLPMLLYSRCITSEKGNSYVFETRANGSTAKTPLDMYSESQIPNDMAAVCAVVREFNSGDEYQEAGDPKPSGNFIVNTNDKKIVEYPAPKADAETDVDKLIALMARDGISNAEISRYCADPKRAWIADGDLELVHIRPDKLAKMVEPGVWARVITAIKQPATAKTPDPFTIVKGVQTLMELSGVTDQEMNDYCATKAVETGKPCWSIEGWRFVDVATLEKLTVDEVWEKVCARVQKMRVENQGMPF